MQRNSHQPDTIPNKIRNQLAFPLIFPCFLLVITFSFASQNSLPAPHAMFVLAINSMLFQLHRHRDMEGMPYCCYCCRCPPLPYPRCGLHTNWQFLWQHTEDSCKQPSAPLRRTSQQPTCKLPRCQIEASIVLQCLPVHCTRVEVRSCESRDAKPRIRTWRSQCSCRYLGVVGGDGGGAALLLHVHSSPYHEGDEVGQTGGCEDRLA